MKYRHRVLGVLSIFAVITYVDRICISVGGKDIQKDLGLTSAQWGWVLGAFIVAYATFEIPSGVMGDRIGPRKVLTRIVIWWSVFTSLTGLVRGFADLVITRFLFGVGEAGAYPNASTTISRWFPKTERARAQGVIWMASKLGGALSPLLVIPIQQKYGWRTSFFVFGVFGVAWALLWYRWFRDVPKEKRGVSAAEVAEIGEAPSHRHRGLPWWVILRRPNLWWIMLGYHAHCWPAFFYLTWLFTFLEGGRGFSKSDLLQLSWVPFIFGALANVLGGIASDYLVQRIGIKWGRRTVGLVGHGLSAVFIAAVLFTQDKGMTIFFLALGYAGSDFALPAAWAVCLDVGGEFSGAVTGAMNTAGQIGSFLATVLFGYLVESYGSYDLPMIPIVVMAIISMLGWFKIDPTEPLVIEHPGLTQPSVAAATIRSRQV